MARGFDSYLLLILIIIFALISLCAVLLIGKKRRKIPQKAPKVIDGGNISVFFDKGNNVTIIPYAKDKYGVGRAVGAPVLLKWPFNSEALGGGVRKAMSLCGDGTPCTNNQLMTILNYNDWKEFSIGKRNISVNYREDHGVVMNSTIRRSDGSYQFNQLGFEKSVPADATDKQLGEVLLEVLPNCRA